MIFSVRGLTPNADNPSGNSRVNTMTKIGNNYFAEVEIYGKRYLAKVLKVHPCGTLDVELSSGKCFRVSGLAVTA